MVEKVSRKFALEQRLALVRQSGYDDGYRKGLEDKQKQLSEILTRKEHEATIQLISVSAQAIEAVARAVMYATKQG